MITSLKILTTKIRQGRVSLRNPPQTTSVVACSQDHQYEDVDNYRGPGQSQAISKSNTNTTSTVVTNTNGQKEQGHSQIITTPSLDIRNVPHALLAALQPTPIAFMKEGREQDFKGLVSYFRNMTKLYKCLQPYSCLKKIFKSFVRPSTMVQQADAGSEFHKFVTTLNTRVSLGPVPWFSEPKQDSDFAPVRRTMDEFLQTGRPATLTKLLTLLCDKSDRILWF
ncbi:hypothetical protein Bbelb_026650 [Branchiostoma belcheri]|nr:hypothetical protein Bbelb_026650 [Branchiostoma belcheri]